MIFQKIGITETENFIQNIINILDEIQLVNKQIKEELHLAKEVSIDDL